MTPRRWHLKRSTGVTLDLAVLDYLRTLAETEDRDRSSCINRIIREHAERNGHPLPPARPLPPPTADSEE